MRKQNTPIRMARRVLDKLLDHFTAATFLSIQCAISAKRLIDSMRSSQAKFLSATEVYTVYDDPRRGERVTRVMPPIRVIPIPNPRTSTAQRYVTRYGSINSSGTAASSHQSREVTNYLSRIDGHRIMRQCRSGRNCEGVYKLIANYRNFEAPALEGVRRLYAIRVRRP